MARATRTTLMRWREKERECEHAFIFNPCIYKIYPVIGARVRMQKGVPLAQAF